ncbi:MAG TPA: TPM domain-containing protein [Pyrinomonadaceae bacterium]|nr:TPM domain-containing protein [Pyrinomonadaceae bacterium]
MEQSKRVWLISLALSFLLSFCLIGCARVAETRSDLPNVPAPEDQPAPTPETPRKFPSASGFVNDFAEVLDPAAERDIENKLAKFQKKQKVDFAVVTILSTGPESIDDYSLQMAKEWKIGSENGGLLLVISREDRKWRIQIDRELEKLITNEETYKIGELMVPAFRKNDYKTGLQQAVDAAIATLTAKLNASPIR